MSSVFYLRYLVKLYFFIDFSTAKFFINLPITGNLGGFFLLQKQW